MCEKLSKKKKKTRGLIQSLKYYVDYRNSMNNILDSLFFINMFTYVNIVKIFVFITLLMAAF